MKRSTLSTDVLLIFDIRDLNGIFFLKASVLFGQLFALVPSTVTVLFTTICA